MCVCLALEEQYHRTSPVLECLLHLLDVVESVVGGLLTYTKDCHDVIAATCL